METRNVALTLEKAREFYNSGNEALKEIALQAFKDKELTPNFRDITTFGDACIALGLSQSSVKCDLARFEDIEGNLGKHLAAIYKLDIIRKALNNGWKPKLDEGDVYYAWVRFYEPNKVPSDKKVIGTIITNKKKYIVVGGYGDYGYSDGLGHFYSGYGYGYSNADLGLLGCKSREIALYLSEHFGDIIFDACYAHHDNYEWV